MVRIAEGARAPVEGVARVYFGIGARLARLAARCAAQVTAETPWQKLAAASIVEDLLALQADLASRAMTAAGGLERVESVAEVWQTRNKAGLARFDALLAELKAAPVPEIAALAVTGRELRALTGA